MKKQSAITVLALFLACCLSPLSAQNENIWLGGKPGRPTDWNTAANWSKQRVPSEFDDVLIPNTATTTRTYPVINITVEMQSLRVETGATIVMGAYATLVIHSNGREEVAFMKPKAARSHPTAGDKTKQDTMAYQEGGAH